jgi:hypothetical protein
MGKLSSTVHYVRSISAGTNKVFLDYHTTDELKKRLQYSYWLKIPLELHPDMIREYEQFLERKIVIGNRVKNADQMKERQRKELLYQKLLKFKRTRNSAKKKIKASRK